MLIVEKLTKKFGTKMILDAVSFKIKKGEIALFLGESGVGKSTLLRLLANLEKPDAGTIHLDSETLDIVTLRHKHLVGMVFQHFNLFEHLTVEQNITLALEKVLGKTTNEAHNIAQELLAHYQLADKASFYVSKLSGGQKQRLAIARSVALKPQIICMDEPTSALDPLLTSHVANTIQDLANQGYIVLIASHDIALLEKLDCTIYLMRKGKIIESVRTHEFQQNEQLPAQIQAFISGTSVDLKK